MMHRYFALLSFFFCIFLAGWAFLGLGSPIANAQFRAPANAISVTCSVAGVDSSLDRYLTCVDHGGLNNALDYQTIPAGKYLFVTDINIVPTQVFTTTTPAMLRLSREPVTGPSFRNIFYEMRIVDANSKSASFQAPIIRINPGEKMFAENLTSNSFTNDLRVYVTGWLTESDTFVPTSINGVQSTVQLAQTPNWQVVLLMFMVFATGAQYWQLRKNTPS